MNPSSAVVMQGYQGVPFGATQTAPEQPPRQVPDQIQALDASVKILESALEHLASRLEPVLRKEPRNPDKQNVPEELLVSTASDIRSVRHRIDNLINGIAVTLSTLEL